MNYMTLVFYNGVRTLIFLPPRKGGQGEAGRAAIPGSPLPRGKKGRFGNLETTALKPRLAHQLEMQEGFDAFAAAFIAV
ncbi:MAG TPA: hypothetical protein VMT98_08615, partial [Verrucomicrobiae bacterium]|nr:hypothetical protein [Verrucomicrobiae bacterium]